MLLVGSTENVTLWPESLVALTSYVSPNFGFVGGVEVNVIWSPPGSVGPVGPVVGSVGPLVGSVGLDVVSVGAVDGGVDAGVTDGAALVGRRERRLGGVGAAGLAVVLARLDRPHRWSAGPTRSECGLAPAASPGRRRPCCGSGSPRRSRGPRSP